MTNTDFEDYIEVLKKDFRLYAPVLEAGKGKFAGTDVVGYGEINTASDMILDQKSYYSPKEIFYPIRETLFYFLNDRIFFVRNHHRNKSSSIIWQ